MRVSCLSPHYKMSRWLLNLLASNVMFTFFTFFVLASNGLLTDLLGTGSAHSDEPFWMEKIKHQGISPFNPNSTEYKVFRNVKVRRTVSSVLILCSSVFIRIMAQLVMGFMMMLLLSSDTPLIHALWSSFWLMFDTQFGDKRSE